MLTSRGSHFHPVSLSPLSSPQSPLSFFSCIPTLLCMEITKYAHVVLFPPLLIQNIACCRHLLFSLCDVFWRSFYVSTQKALLLHNILSYYCTVVYFISFPINKHLVYFQSSFYYKQCCSDEPFLIKLKFISMLNQNRGIYYHFHT